MKNTSGFSLTELLVVIAIIVLLAALLFPVFSKAKDSSQAAPCMSNLRQVGVAWQLYSQSHNDLPPPAIGNLILFDKTVIPVLKCPLDKWKGANSDDSEKTRHFVSYFTLDQRPDFRKALEEADANHGIFYCITHGRSRQGLAKPVETFDIEGLVLRLRLDLSVQKAEVPSMCGPNSPNGRIMGRSRWTLLTDAKCVEPFCDGLTLPCGE
jgi:prepilin-type N-terminal cleavage/methylation domain-containing protein